MPHFRKCIHHYFSFILIWMFTWPEGPRKKNPNPKTYIQKGILYKNGCLYIFEMQTSQYFFLHLWHTYRGIHEKGSRDVVSAVCHNIYTIFLSLCTQTAATTFPEPFSWIPLYMNMDYIGWIGLGICIVMFPDLMLSLKHLKIQDSKFFSGQS